MEQTSRTQKSDFWTNHIEQCRESGMSQKQYCKINNLALSTFGYWKRKSKQKEPEKVHFYPLVLPEAATERVESGLTLKFKDNRFCIEIESHFSQPALKRLITTLEQL